MGTNYNQEIESGDRFAFGKNWSRFVEQLDDNRIAEAERSLSHMLGIEDLAGKTFLDIGSGSGLFSLAARKMGARVHSFDYDLQSVECAGKLRSLYFPDDPDWVIEHSSILDVEYVNNLGQFDIVYSWGVLHHTGEMWAALKNAILTVKDGGLLFVAIYNDQGRSSNMWKKVKYIYNQLPDTFKFLILWPSFARLWGPTLLRDLIHLRPMESWKRHKEVRGMSPWHDVVDWVGGYPFEVAKPEEIFEFYHSQGFQLERLVTCAGGIGCNEYIFHKTGTV